MTRARHALLAAVALTALANAGAAQGQESVRVAEASFFDHWEWLVGWRDFPLVLNGDVEICIDTHWQFPAPFDSPVADPSEVRNNYFEFRCDSSGSSDRLTYARLGECGSLTDPPPPVQVLQLDPGGEQCNLRFTGDLGDADLEFFLRGQVYVRGRRAACARAADRVCLAGDYAIAVDYMDSAGNWVRGAPQKKLSESAAVFYFFDPDNAEVLVKLLDACGLTGHRWLYSAPATGLAYRITVYAPVDGVPHVWTANAGSGAADTRFTSVWAITDTEAFRCSEEP